jgi:hypothetical protein
VEQFGAHSAVSALSQKHSNYDSHNDKRYPAGREPHNKALKQEDPDGDLLVILFSELFLLLDIDDSSRHQND